MQIVDNVFLQCANLTFLPLTFCSTFSGKPALWPSFQLPPGDTAVCSSLAVEAAKPCFKGLRLPQRSTTSPLATSKAISTWARTPEMGWLELPWPPAAGEVRPCPALTCGEMSWGHRMPGQTKFTNITSCCIFPVLLTVLGCLRAHGILPPKDTQGTGILPRSLTGLRELSHLPRKTTPWAAAAAVEENRRAPAAADSSSESETEEC